MYYSANKDNFFTNKFKKKDNHIFIPSTSESPEECIIAEADHKECYDFMTEKFIQSKRLGFIRNAWWIKHMNFSIKDEDIIWIDMEKPHIYQIEISLTNRCNLNCTSCMHFCNIADEDAEVSVDEFESYLRKLSKLQIVRIELLGGETLLVPDLEVKVKLARQYFPNSEIVIITNGLLLNKMKESFWKTIRDNKVLFSVSIYGKMHKNYIKLKSLFIKKKIMFRLYLVSQFQKFLTLNGNHDPVYENQKCPTKPCRIIYKNNVYHCPVEAKKYFLEKKFNIKLAKENPISIDDFVDNPDKLNEPSNLCKYCTSLHFSKWIKRNKIEMSDWIVNE